MTFHQALVIYAGLSFSTAGVFTFGVWQMLSPSDRDRLTVGWIVRTIIFLHALACFGRGITLIFPGRLVATEYMSPMVPLAATTTLLVAAAAAELLQRYRLPPPIMERFVRAFTAFRDEGPHGAQAAAAEEAAAVRLSSPHLRWLVLASCLLGLFIVLACVLTAAAATPG